MVKYGDNIDALVTDLRISQARQGEQINALNDKVDDIHADVKEIRKMVETTKAEMIKYYLKIVSAGGGGAGIVFGIIELVKHLT